MIYKITLSSNPKLYFLFLFIIGIVVAGVFLLIHFGVPWGVVGILGTLYASYLILKPLIPYMKSTIETSEVGITCYLPGKETAHFRWENLTHAGLCQRENQKPLIFLYSEQNDRLVTIPREFTHFDRLLEEIKAKVDIQEIQLSKDETIQDRLRAQLDNDPTND